ncbi:hypothetical protein NQ315_002858 [Exocentrus adspersus]|uniref:DUF4817 domain-containing protein n=1 Tax=Exocentrus adspersus TaxID=1586481 RepID=A0AAV8V8T0_9CUCU|nr:hypothetical protein NQ315_002858 [Exocentrus adspersus]
MFTQSEKVDMLLIFGECHKNSRNAAELYAKRYLNRQNSFRQDGNRNAEETFIINEDTEINSFRLNHESARNILKKHGYQAFKCDGDRRVVLCDWLLKIIEVTQILLTLFYFLTNPDLRIMPGNVPLDNVAEGYLILLVKLGVEEELSENTFKDIEKFVIHLYSTNDNAKIWLNSNIPQQEIMLPSYERSGWKIEEGKLVAVLLTQPAFPEDTSVLSTCNCKKRRKGIKKSLCYMHTFMDNIN